MGLERNAPTYAILGVPAGWKKVDKHVARKNRQGEFAFSGEAHLYSTAEAQNRRWRELTGVEPADSSFTIIMPIHNERKYLTAAIGSLMVSDIPADAEVSVVFVTNNCSDESPAIVDKLMENIGEIEIYDSWESFITYDRGTSRKYTHTKAGNWTFTHINPSTAGKANALNIGNAFADEKGDRIALCIDANNFVEPDAIGLLFAEAYHSIVEKPDGTAVLSGERMAELKAGKSGKFIEHIREKLGRPELGPRIVLGWIMAWDTKFLMREEGVPPVVIEDYGLGVMARAKNRKIKRLKNVRSWGYESNNFRDRFSQRVRQAQGRLQIMQRGADEANIVEQDNPDLVSPFSYRVKSLYRKAKEDFSKAPYFAMKFIIWEYAMLIARYKMKVNPNSQTWPYIKSTK